MVTGKTSDNYTYYRGFEDEPEIVLSITDHSSPRLHIWDGYFYDIFSPPHINGQGWHGFTRDYHQMKGVFSVSKSTDTINPAEYIADMKQYSNQDFRFPETKKVYDLILSLLRQADIRGQRVSITISD